MLDLTTIKARLAEHKCYSKTPIGANGNVISFSDIDSLIAEVERLQQDLQDVTAYHSYKRCKRCKRLHMSGYICPNCDDGGED